MKTPYKKQYDSKGILLNPITKENPYLFAGADKIKQGFRFWQKARNKFFIGREIVKM